MSGGKSVVALARELDEALSAFKLGFESGRIAHAYLLAGDPNGRALRLAEQMLSVLCCKSAIASRPCGRCSGCGRVARRVHPDFMWIEPRKKSRTIQREQVMAVHNHVFHTSYEGGWKGVVLVNAERLNEVAANTLLKMLEEPPEATLFLLLSASPEALLPTVASRCQRMIILNDSDVDASPGDDGMAGNVSGSGRESLLREAVVDVMTNGALAGGGVVAGMARARSLLEVLKSVRKELEQDEKHLLDDELENGGERSDDKDLLTARVESRYGASRHTLLLFLLQWYRDILLGVCGIAESAFTFYDQAIAIRRMCEGMSVARALGNIRQIEDMKEQIDRHIPEASVFERGMIALARGGGKL